MTTVSENEDNEILETLRILNDRSMMKGLQTSAEDIEAGRVSHYASMSDLRAEILADTAGSNI